MANARRHLVLVGMALAVLVVSLVIVGPAVGRPDSVSLSDSRDVLASPKESLQELQDEARTMRATMTRLEAEMEALTLRWRESRRSLDEINQRLLMARRDLDRSEHHLERQRDVIAARMITMYKVGQYSWLDLVTSSASMADAQVAIGLMGKISELDKDQETELHRLAAEARGLETQIQKDREEAISVQADIEEQRAEMNLKIAEREAVLKDVVTRIKKILAAPELMMKAGGKVTQVTWAQAFLKSLDMRLTRDNLAAIVAWEMAEGGHWYNTAHYNPLNTSQPMPGARTFNSHGVKIYNSWSQGLKATVITINNGFYPQILAALRAGNDGQAVASAVAASPWGTGLFTVRD